MGSPPEPAPQPPHRTGQGKLLGHTAELTGRKRRRREGRRFPVTPRCDGDPRGWGEHNAGGHPWNSGAGQGAPAQRGPPALAAAALARRPPTRPLPGPGAPRLPGAAGGVPEAAAGRAGKGKEAARRPRTRTSHPTGVTPLRGHRGTAPATPGGNAPNGDTQSGDGAVAPQPQEDTPLSGGLTPHRGCRDGVTAAAQSGPCSLSPRTPVPAGGRPRGIFSGGDGTAEDTQPGSPVCALPPASGGDKPVRGVPTAPQPPAGSLRWDMTGSWVPVSPALSPWTPQ